VTWSDVPRSSLSVGLEWASRITSVGLTFALPPLLGAALDRWWGTSPVALLVGAVLGFAAGIMQTLQLARAGTNNKKR
jgi:F0F1-type ATP synthase assembly protein I